MPCLPIQETGRCGTRTAVRPIETRGGVKRESGTASSNSDDNLRPASRSGRGTDRGDIVQLGGDPAPGILYNATPGARPFDPPDAARPTLVIVHGINLVPRASHLPMAQRLGEAVARRGPAAERAGLGLERRHPGRAEPACESRARGDPRAAARSSLARSGPRARTPAPDRPELWGNRGGLGRSGTRETTGESVAQVTLLDPAVGYHDLVFRRLGVGSCCGRVDHYWAPGPAGLSRQVNEAGVHDQRVKVPERARHRHTKAIGPHERGAMVY